MSLNIDYSKYTEEDTFKALWAAITANGTVSTPTSVPVTGSLSTTPGASELHLGEVGGNIAVATASFARPADTTAYAALDAVSNSTSAPTALQFAGASRNNGGSGYIAKARLITDQSTNTARFRLHLYTQSPTAINDNSPQTLLWANRTTRIGYVDFAAASTEGTGSTAANSLNVGDRIAYQTDAADTKLYGLLETLDAFTPASAQNVFIELTFDRN